MEREQFKELNRYVEFYGIEDILKNSLLSTNLLSKIQDPHFQALVRIYIQAGDILKSYIKEKANEHN